MGDTLPPTYFDRKYAADPDPWRFATSPYEAAKYQATLDALPHPRAARAFEAGCSIGVLTDRLADRCDTLLSADVAERALAQARLRLAAKPHVTIERRALPHDWPPGSFDLFVFSEVLYYLGRDDLAETARRTAASLRAGGAVIVVHWLGPTDYPLTGDDASTLFIDALRPTAVVTRSARSPDYRLDVLERPPAA